MASGPIVGGGGDGSRDNKHRWGDGKVYTRKAHNKGSKKSALQQQQQQQQQPSQTTGHEDGNSSQQQLLTRSDAASDDSSSLNRRQSAAPNTRELPSGNGSVRPVFPRLENRVTISLSSKSKQEMRELRRKLTNELDQVRSLVKKLEAREVQLTGFSGGGGGGYSHSQLSANDGVDNSGTKRLNSEVGSIGHHEARPLHQLSISVVENSQGVSDVVEKEKRTPKANQYYRNSDFVLGKEKFPPPESNKKSKFNGKKHGGDEEFGFLGFGMDKYSSQVFKSCTILLAKLMKHKHGWVFNTPVDVKGLGLHDYYTIIKHPMDLGTVKSRLNKNWYMTPREFAEDVRLTFLNAMTYNPKGQDVHVMAEQLLKIFEDKWVVIEAEYNLNSRFRPDHDVILPTPTSRKTIPPPSYSEMRRTLDRSESTTLPVDSNLKASNFAPPVPGRTPALKKPKAKDLHKRDMTYEEKQRLSTNLQSLPSEKLDNIVQIIKKRNSSLCQHDDEIEVDIDSVDAETLWELDRFVTNYKKSLSKNKRKAELAIQARAEAEVEVEADHNVQRTNPDPAMVEAPKEPKTDKKIVSSSSPVQAEKQGDNASRSSSSSSSSSDSGSSSSDSDSESSSAFGSDAPRT